MPDESTGFSMMTLKSGFGNYSHQQSIFTTTLIASPAVKYPVKAQQNLKPDEKRKKKLGLQ